ncbi:MAG TPA: heavy-metal-associated domain-containing protein [Acidimicrobiia bacterium]
MQVFTVEGMSCGHCVNAVTEQISSLDGVQRVDVDLGTGAVTVMALRELDELEVGAAVEEAGYELVRDAPASGR